jgi:hypothetical protein
MCSTTSNAFTIRVGVTLFWTTSVLSSLSNKRWLCSHRNRPENQGQPKEIGAALPVISASVRPSAMVSDQAVAEASSVRAVYATFPWAPCRATTPVLRARSSAGLRFSA